MYATYHVLQYVTEFSRSASPSQFIWAAKKSPWIRNGPKMTSYRKMIMNKTLMKLILLPCLPSLKRMTSANISPVQQENSNIRKIYNMNELFLVNRAKTERLKKSSIINMQKLLNNEASKKKETMTKISNYMSVNYDCMQSLSLRK